MSPAMAAFHFDLCCDECMAMFEVGVMPPSNAPEWTMFIERDRRAAKRAAKKAGWVVDGKIARCPAHAAAQPSTQEDESHE